MYARNGISSSFFFCFLRARTTGRRYGCSLRGLGYSLGMVAPHRSLRLTPSAHQPTTTNSPLSSMELSHIEAQQSSTGQQERLFKATPSSTEVTPLMTSRRPLPKGQGRGSRSEQHQRPRSQALSRCLGGFLEGLHARGRNKGSLWYSVKAFSTAAAVVLVLVIALQGLVRGRTQQYTVQILSTAQQETVYNQAQ